MQLSYWKQKISQILGYFWTEVFRDNWLIQAISKSFNYVLGNSLIASIDDIKSQLRFNYNPSTTGLFPFKVLIPKSHIKEQYRTQDFLTGKTTTAIKYIFINSKNAPYKIQNTIENPTCQILSDEDFVYQNKCIRFQTDKWNLIKQHFNTVYVYREGDVVQCYQMWFSYKNTSFILDTLSSFLQLPIQWTYKYPGSLYLAWKIRQQGVTFGNLKEFMLSFGCDIEKTTSELTDQTIQRRKVKFLQYNLSMQLNKDLKSALDFIQKQLPLGTIFIVYDSKGDKYTAFQPETDNNIYLLKTQKDFDSMSKYGWKETNT